ncbi:MAG: PilZ domain-containing protein [Nitrospirae bacterium]|nr:PilZ domain-containing protein [Nitrospirota bacterium]MBI3593528.1 PilZ domain-containing protein [Nitrospirota bacterium]
MHTPRKYPRFPITGSAVVKTGYSQLEFPGSIEMFSRCGVGISTQVVIQKGTPIFLEADIHTGSRTSRVLLSGVVKNFTEWGEKNLIGVQFDQEISPDHEPRLYDYLGCLEKELIKEFNRFS